MQFFRHIFPLSFIMSLCLILSAPPAGAVDFKVKGRWIFMADYGKYEILGRTRDDAAGEAFDKVARAIGLGYPGGPKIEKAAREGDPMAIPFPKAKVNDNPYDFSFSGVKSAVLNYINGCKMKNIEIVPEDIAASFQKAVTDVLIAHAMHAAEEFKIDNIELIKGHYEDSIDDDDIKLEVESEEDRKLIKDLIKGN